MGNKVQSRAFPPDNGWRIKMKPKESVDSLFRGFIHKLDAENGVCLPKLRNVVVEAGSSPLLAICVACSDNADFRTRAAQTLDAQLAGFDSVHCKEAAAFETRGICNRRAKRVRA